MIDRTRDSEARAMVRTLGVRDPEIVRALETVPRHRFVPAEFQGAAYEDEPLPLHGADATISAPHMVAIQLESARLRPGVSVLEIGSGSGYLLALVAELVGPSGRALGIEIEPGLVESSRRALAELGYDDRARVRAGDGFAGAPDAAPFDRILVSCAVREVAPAWRDQLSKDGRIVAPVGGRLGQRLLTVDRDLRVLESGPECRFVLARSPQHPINRPAM